MRLPYKEILITGGAGFVGSNLAVKFKESYSNIKITCLDNLRRRGSELSLPRLKKYGIKFKHADIRNKEDFEGLRCDLLIECSAEPSVIAGIKSNLNYLINTNLLGTINCLNFALENRSDFLFVSTCRIYPFDKINSLNFVEKKTRFVLSPNQKIKGVSSEGIKEDFSLEGMRTFYGATKLASELLLKEYIYFKKMRGIVNRCGIITGRWQMGKVEQGVVVYWIASHIFGRPLRYIGWQGKQVRDFLHIDDFFRLIELQLKNFNKYNGEVFNVGGGKDFSFSLIELTFLCRKVTGRKVLISKDKNLREGDVIWYISDISKVKRLFRWKPSKTLEGTLEEIAKWIVDNRSFLQKVL